MSKEVCNHCGKHRIIDDLMEMEYSELSQHNRRTKEIVYYCYTCAIEIAGDVLSELESLVK